MRFLVAVLILSSVAFTPATTWADSDTKTALADGRDALKHFQKGEFSSAQAKFAKADALYHTPVFVLYLARCHRELGELLQARTRFDEVVAEKLDEDAPPPWTKAQADAATERAALDPLIPTLKVDVDVDATEVALTIDDKPAKLGEAIDLDPGTHVVATRYRGQSSTREVTLDQGAREYLELKLAIAQPSPPEPDPKATEPKGPIQLPPPSPAERDEPSGLTTAGYVLSGLGVVGLITGAITGAVALSEDSKAGDGCNNDVCPPENEQHETRATQLAHGSTGSFVVGGLAIGVGIILMLVDATDSSDAAFFSPSGFRLRF